MPKWLKTLLTVASVVLNLLGGSGIIPPVVGAPNALVK
jgi:hypothetical protein